jgi:tetratricopeptide (TPR) repeat protein
MILPLYLTEYLQWRRRFDDWLAVTAVSRDSARQLNDKGNEAASLNNLGLALVELRRFEEALACYEQDIAICRETGDLYGGGQTLDNLGSAYREMRQPGQAAARWLEAAAAMRDAGDHEEAARLEQLAENAQIGQHP